MIEVTKVTKGDVSFLRIEIKALDPEIVPIIMSIDGWDKSSQPMVYGIPYEKAAEFYRKTVHKMVIWKSNGDNMGALSSGIDTNDVPTDYTVPYSPKIPLRPHQIQAFNLLMQRDYMLVADQEGVGKTPPVLCSHEAKVRMGLAKWGLFVTKAALIYDVKNQAERFTDLNVAILGGEQNKRLDLYYKLEKSDNIDLVVVSYETYRRDIQLLLALHQAKPFSIMYCDEAHKAKNRKDAEIGQAIHQIVTPQRYAITATPIINEIIDCYNILSWMGAISYTWFAFTAKFCVMDGMGRVLSYKNVGEFKVILQSNMLRRLKTNVLDLPKVISKVSYVKMTPDQKKLYKKVELAGPQEKFEDLDFEDIPAELARFARLMQVAESSETVGGTPGKRGSGKLAELEELLAEIVSRGEKAVVFSRSKRFTMIMYKYFAKYNPAVVTGDVASQATGKQTTSDRQRQVDMFQEDASCKVIFCCEAAAREGWTGTAANNVIFTSKPWSPAYASQCIGRVYRFGQEGGTTGSINVYTIISSGTIDERVEQLLAEKQFTIDAAVEQPLGTTKILKVLEGISVA